MLCTPPTVHGPPQSGSVVQISQFSQDTSSDYIGCLYLELVYSLLDLGDVDAVIGRIVAHNRSLLLSFGKQPLPEGRDLLSVGVLCAARRAI